MKKVKTVVTGVGSRIRELIKEGKLSNNEILELVRKEHPLRKTTYACVAWYQSKMRKEALEAAPVEAAPTEAVPVEAAPTEAVEVDPNQMDLFDEPAETVDDLIAE